MSVLWWLLADIIGAGCFAFVAIYSIINQNIWGYVICVLYILALINFRGNSNGKT